MKNILILLIKTLLKCGNAKSDTNKEIELLESQHEMPHTPDKALLNNSETLTRCQTNKYGVNALRKLGKEKDFCGER